MIPRKAFLSVAVLVAATACGPNQRILESSNAHSNTSSDISSPVAADNAADTALTIRRDIDAMKTADFNFIFVFRRKDGGVIDNDDKQFVNRNTPAETNRRQLSDGGRAIIMGANYRWPPETIRIFGERFDVEDHSKPESEMIKPNSNTAANGTR
ncbi:MAG: hypothetical protein ABI539_05330 [Acidobacteriota bacterium]